MLAALSTFQCPFSEHPLPSPVTTVSTACQLAHRWREPAKSVLLLLLPSISLPLPLLRFKSQNATQWKAVIQEALQIAILLIILDRLGFVDGDPWLETLLDTMSVQATLFSGRPQSWADRLKTHLEFTARVEHK